MFLIFGTETISKLTRVNPDRNMFSKNVELKSTFFTLQRFGPSPSPNFKYIRQFKMWKSQNLCCSAMYPFFYNFYCCVVYSFYHAVQLYIFNWRVVYNFYCKTFVLIFSLTRLLFTFSTCSTRPLSTPPPNLNSNIYI